MTKSNIKLVRDLTRTRQDLHAAASDIARIGAQLCEIMATISKSARTIEEIEQKYAVDEK